MPMLSDETNAYIEKFGAVEPPILAELARETHLKVLRPHMISGRLQGRLLSMVSHMIRPQRVLEIGTFTGYGTLCLAEGLSENGRLYTIDIDVEVQAFAGRYVQKTPFYDKIVFLCGEALHKIDEIEEGFDLVYIDADKKNNSLYYDRVIEKVNKGGFILIDNVLKQGKVAENPEFPTDDKDVRAIRKLNTKIQADPRVDQIILPIRDGLMLIRKK